MVTSQSGCYSTQWKPSQHTVGSAVREAKRDHRPHRKVSLLDIFWSSKRAATDLTSYLSTAQKIARIGAGASPLMSRTLTSEGLAQAITFCLRTDVQQSTQAIRRQVEEEAGLENAIRSFYRSFPSQVQTCGITKQCLAMYQIWNKPSLLVSSEAAAVLVQENRIKVTDIVL